MRRVKIRLQAVVAARWDSYIPAAMSYVSASPDG
jgi:hypothetical protein